jgi:PAS domain S-box-containing protein
MNNTKTVSSAVPIRILHVDDDADFLEVATQILKISGDFEVDSALNTDEAYKKMSTQQYDVIICDYEMPIKDGLQFLKELRANKNNIAFMLFTGKGREEVAMTALNLGADGYYSKHGSTETVFGELVHGIKKVTDELRVKQALGERERHYRALMDQAVDSILLLEYPPDGLPVIRDANAATLKMHGYTPEELIGNSIMFLDPHIGEQRIREIAVAMKEEKSLTFETLHQRKDGSKFNVEVHIKGLNFGSEVWAIAIERDVTERKRAQEALRSSEARYKALFEQAGDSILLMEIQLGQLPIIRDANSSALRVLGYSREELLGKPISFIDPNADVPKTDMLIKHLREKNKHSFETKHRRKDGSIMEVEALVKAIRIGSDIWFLSIHRDITARKLAETALKRSEAQFRALFDHSVDSIFIFRVNEAGNMIIVDANPAACKTHGYAREELIDESISLIDKNVTSEQARIIKEKLSDTPIVMRVKHQRKDGSVFDVEASIIRMILDGKSVGVSFERNITEQSNIEKSLRMGDARFRALYDNSYDAVLLMKPDGRIVSANATACRMFGWSEQELKELGRSSVFVMDERTYKAIQNREITGQAKAELTFRRKDGSTFEGDITSTSFIEPNGEKSVSLIIRDITERKKAELNLKESSEKIKAMNEKLRVVGSLTRHDVKNKLSIINANIYLLKKRLGNDPELAKYLDAINTAVLSSDKLFEFSRLYEKIGADELTLINVEDCFNEAVALTPNLIGVEVTNEYKGVTVTADSLLRQLFYNFIDNSLKHGVKVTRIKAYLTRNEQATTLFYEDNGIGISAENKQKLFTESFTTGKGSGLGLRLAKRMVDVYGWSIKETGVPDEGVRFEITIPNSYNQNKSLADFL